MAWTALFAINGWFGGSSAAAAAFKLSQAPARSTRPAGNPIPPTAESVRAGRLVYAQICRNCHGLQGKGDGTAAPPGSKPANLVDAEWKHGGTDAEIFKTIKEGVGPDFVMEAMGAKLHDQAIWNVINFLRDFAKPKPPR